MAKGPHTQGEPKKSPAVQDTSKAGPLTRLRPRAKKEGLAPFGSIRFPELRAAPAKFVRVENLDTEKRAEQEDQILHVLNLLLQTWKVKAPSAIISIPQADGNDDAEVDDITELGGQLELVLKRGLADAVADTSAWVITGGRAGNPMARVVGQAMESGRHKYPGAPFNCIGVVPYSELAERERLDKLINGTVHKYVGKASKGSSSSSSSESSSTGKALELDHLHSHFLMVEEGSAQGFRDRFERLISAKDLSGDNVQTPRMMLVVGGNEHIFEAVAAALDPDDEATGAPVPVLVLGDSGGAAADIYQYVMGCYDTWEAKEEDRVYPYMGRVRDAEYIAKARELLPKILERGKLTGQNDSRQLSFYAISRDVGEEQEDLSLAIQKSMLNDCPNRGEEALLSVVWGEPELLEAMLEESANEILTYTQDNDKVMTRSTGKERQDLLQLALIRKDVPVISTILKFCSHPSFVCMNDLFVASHNTYPVTRVEWPYAHDSLATAPAPAAAAPRASSPAGKSAKVSPGAGERKASDAVANGSPTGKRAMPVGRSMTRSITMSIFGDSSKMVTKRGWESAAEILADMIGGYEFHLDARWDLFLDESAHLRVTEDEEVSYPPGLIGKYTVNVPARNEYGLSTLELRMAPSWTDLMMWAVLTGSHELARLLWERTSVPLRAANMASQLCRMLAGEPSLLPDSESLLAEAETYESMAIDVLDAIRDSNEATKLLTLIPWAWEIPSEDAEDPAVKRVMLWDESVIENAAEGDGMLSVPSMRLAAHRHSQFCLEQFFVGEFPGSRARIAKSASLVKIFLQALLPFAPGTLVEVEPTESSPNKPLQGAQTQEQYKELVSAGLVRSQNCGVEASGNESQQKERAADVELDPDTLDVVSSVNRNVSVDPAGLCSDLVADLFSARFLLFYMVPKVKFTLHFGGQLAFIAFFSFFIFSRAEDFTNEITRREITLLAWIGTRFFGELMEIDFSGRGVWIYIRDPWNMMDVIFAALTVVNLGLRLAATAEAGDEAYTNESTSLELLPRSVYAVLVILSYFRILQFLRYFKSVGVLTIVVGHMMADVAYFFVLFLVASLGFGVAFTMLMPLTSQSVHFVFGDHPLWTPFWATFGSVKTGSAFMAGEVLRDDGSDPSIFFGPTLLWFYLFIVVIIYVNLLIAQMADTYARVTERGVLVWQFERAQLIDEFKDTKPPLPPPLNVIWFLFATVPFKLRKWYREKFLGVVQVEFWGFKLVPMQQELELLRRMESEALKRALLARKKREEETLDERIANLTRKLVKLDEQARHNFESLNGRFDAMTKAMKLDQQSRARGDGALSSVREPQTAVPMQDRLTSL